MYQWVADEFARQTRKDGPVGPILFGLFWSALVGGICVVIAAGAARQVASADRPTADGVVTVSEPTGGRTTGGWELEYQYVVAGRVYTGTRYAYDPMPVAGREVERHVAEYPDGVPVTVYYDPDDPADAVIRPGLRGCTVWVALFLTPFVVIGLGMWAGVVGGYRPPPGFDPADPRQVAETAAGAVAYPDRTGWVARFLTCLGIVAALTAWVLFFVVFGLGGLVHGVFHRLLIDPPVWVPLAVWVAVLGGSGWAAGRVAPVLTVDAAGGVLRFAPALSPRVEVPFAAVGGVTVTDEEVRRRGGAFTRHRVEVARAGGPPLPVAAYDDRRDADALAAWLRQRLPG